MRLNACHFDLYMQSLHITRPRRTATLICEVLFEGSMRATEMDAIYLSMSRANNINILRASCLRSPIANIWWHTINYCAFIFV